MPQAQTNTNTNQEDHDTLIRVETKLESLTGEIRSNNSVSTKMLADHEARIRALENTVEIGRGTVAGVRNNRRTILEVLSVACAIIMAYATYLAGKAHL